jgi:hypothetical protein
MAPNKIQTKWNNITELISTPYTGRTEQSKVTYDENFRLPKVSFIDICLTWINNRKSTIEVMKT